MSIFLEITQLENGDIVLREADEDDGVDGDTPTGMTPRTGELRGEPLVREPLVRIRFSNEVREVLGPDLVGVAEAMIDAATDYLGEVDDGSSESESEAAGVPVGSLLAASKSPTIH
ncbi:MAG: hypothetical protein P8Y69_03095 [Gammaproteobacteria bacterium]|jgi:hypothetical protein